MLQLFADLARSHRNTVELSNGLEFTLEDWATNFPRYPVRKARPWTPFFASEHVFGPASSNRYGRTSPDMQAKARRQIEKELALIEKLKLAGYFLIVWDLVRYCRPGKTSWFRDAVLPPTALSAIRWASPQSMPLGMELLFERFLSEERGEWPDVDYQYPQRRRARKSHSVRLQAIRRTRRRHDRQRHHLSQIA